MDVANKNNIKKIFELILPDTILKHEKIYPPKLQNIINFCDNDL